MITVIIPARYESSRLPGKLLLDLGGKPLLQHTYERAYQADVGPVIIATDDIRIKSAAEGFGARVLMTAPSHQSGTERLAECFDLLALSGSDLVVNVQGDEPFLPPQLIQQVAENLTQNKAASMATLCEEITDVATLFDPHNVKVIFDEAGYASYFSRAVIPWYRDGFDADPKVLPDDYRYYRHIGLYAYRAGFLNQYVSWPASPWEELEALEQLRALWHGHTIHVAVASEAPGVGVDTEADLQAARDLLVQQAG